MEDCEKRENGVVFTPCYIVEYILENTLDDQLADDSIIIDPACGSGAFLVLAAEKLSQKLNKSISETMFQKPAMLSRVTISAIKKNTSSAFLFPNLQTMN